VIGILGSRAAIQRDLNRTEECAERNLMKFNTRKTQNPVPWME